MDLKAKQTNLADLFGTAGRRYVVPAYQRPYAWLDDHVDELWDDIDSAGDAGHFMGSLVMALDDGHPVIIDGQQRLTTLTILLSIVRDRLMVLGEAERAGYINSHLVADPFADGDLRYRLRTGDSTWALYRDLVLRTAEEEQRLRADSLDRVPKAEQLRGARVIANLRRLDELVDRKLGALADDDQKKLLWQLYERVVKGLEFVAIEVGSLPDAFLLFETLNDRGLQLSAADLLKNHLLSQTPPDRVEEIAARWDDMLGLLGPAVDVARFFRHVLLLRHNQVRMEEVYSLFKRETAQTKYDALLDDLTHYARLYGQFEDPVRVDSGEPEVRTVLEDLKTLRASRCYVMLLPARRFLSERDFIRVAQAAEVLTFRYSSVAGKDAKNLELTYQKAGRLLAGGKTAAVDDALRVLGSETPGSEEFTGAFARQRLGTHYLAKYMLRKIEDHLEPTKEKKVQGRLSGAPGAHPPADAVERVARRPA